MARGRWRLAGAGADAGAGAGTGAGVEGPVEVKWDGMESGWEAAGLAGGAIRCNYMQRVGGAQVVLPLPGEVQPRWVVLAELVCLCKRIWREYRRGSR